MKLEDIWIEGRWQTAAANGSFHAFDPNTGEALEQHFPISSWQDCEKALAAASLAAEVLRDTPGEQIAHFLNEYARRIEEQADKIVSLASLETALPVQPRLSAIELPRTTTQLRQAAAAAAEGSWAQIVIDTKANIRSHFAPIGTALIFGPNNFPLAFNSISGGDFAAAIAAGNPVIAKAHPGHPATSKALAECAMEALLASGLPPATVQMIYQLKNDDGLKLVADERIGATSFTGSRAAGLRLKACADAAGRSIYLEMSSMNPVVFLPGLLRERGGKLAIEAADSSLAASGQFCTSPNLFLLIESPEAHAFIDDLVEVYRQRKNMPLLSEAGLHQLEAAVRDLSNAGATVREGAERDRGSAGFCYRNTVLQVTAKKFVADPQLQIEPFGNATTVVLADSMTELKDVIVCLEGGLTGSIYSASDGRDDALYNEIAALLRPRVGRLLNDKMPTGVALSPAMNHGGPYPSTGHPGFTAVGIPRSMLRFGALHCYDGVPSRRLPLALQDVSDNPTRWRQIDGEWRRG